MLSKITQDERCMKCIRVHCINKHTGCSSANKSCFLQSGCASCKFFSVCNNQDKDKFAFDLESRLLDGKEVPYCFVAPANCRECYKYSHCKNKFLCNFKLNLDDPLLPLCFSGYHSTR